MAQFIFPSANDINGGTTGNGKKLREVNLANYNAYSGENQVISGFSQSNSSRVVTISSGIAMIDGYYVKNSSAKTISASSIAGTRNFIFLKLVTDTGGQVTGSTLAKNASATAPTNSIPLWVHQTDGAGTAIASGSTSSPINRRWFAGKANGYFQANMAQLQWFQNTTVTKVNSTYIQHDINGWYLESASRFFPQREGIYEINAAYLINEARSSNRYVQLMIYGPSTLASLRSISLLYSDSTAAIFTPAQGTAAVRLDGKDDFISLYLYHTLGSSAPSVADPVFQNNYWTAKYLGNSTSV